MRSWNLSLAVVLAAGGALTLVGSVLDLRGIVEGGLLVVLVAVLAAMYRLRRYARATLLYRRRRRCAPRTGVGRGTAAAPPTDPRAPATPVLPPAARSANLRTVRGIAAGDASHRTVRARQARAATLRD